TITALSKTIEVGPAGFVYIVDQRGHLIAHPTLLPADDIVDFSLVPAVQKALKGDRGVEILFNPVENEKRLSAYEPVPHYGWGVVVVQPTRTAFIERNKTTTRMVMIWMLVIFAAGFFTYRLLRDKNIIATQRDKERMLLKSIGDGVVAIDRQWTITLWNPAATLISGYAEQEALGKPLRDILKFMRLSDRKENIIFIEEAIVRGKTHQLENETALIRKDGSEILVGDSASPIFDQGGRIIGAIIIFRDVSQERERQALRSDFAYASHQFRTPVNQALWNLETALEGKEPDAIKEAAHIAYFSIRGVQRLMNQLIEVSEIDQGAVIPKREMVKLTQVFDEVAGEVNNEAKARQITFSVAPISMTTAIVTDPKLLKRILTEVLENALYYNITNGTVGLEVATKDNGILISVKDTGIGITKEQQPIVFTKFFRGSNFDTNKIVGAGLGLYIAREYVKLLGGKIWFTSEEKKGTTVSIFLAVGK
ncbi:MAG: ATP-binding protein, partial [bacterium]|nr:ATP-binding protein [bacterium]